MGVYLYIIHVLHLHLHMDAEHDSTPWIVLVTNGIFILMVSKYSLSHDPSSIHELHWYFHPHGV